jgi:inositol-phosphate transport system substrate-binding protein
MVNKLQSTRQFKSEWSRLLWSILWGWSIVLLGACAEEAVYVPAEADSENDDTTIVVAYIPNTPPDQWLLEGLVYASSQVTEYSLLVNAIGFNGINETYRANLSSAIDQEAGQEIAVDVGLLPQTQISRWADRGHIMPVDICRQSYAHFSIIPEPLWDAVGYNGHTWGVPVVINLRLLFFNKTKLRELGWSETSIATLPEKIERGEFTLEDIGITARAAMREGVIRPGFGYWGKTNRHDELISVYLAHGGRVYDDGVEQFVINRMALEYTYRWRRDLFIKDIMLPELAGPAHDSWSTRLLQLDSITQGRLLFWTSHNTDWPNWVRGYEARGKGVEEMYDEIGYALFPTAVSGMSAHTQVIPDYYVLTARPGMTPQKETVICALLARTISPEVNVLYAWHGARPGVSSAANNLPLEGNGRFVQETTRMVLHAWTPPVNQQYESYYSILAEFLAEVETGLLDPETAANLAIEQLQRTFEDTLRVE